MNSWTVGLTVGRGDAVGPGRETEGTTLVELLVEADVSGPQTKAADVVAASVVVVVGVGSYGATGQMIVGWGGEREVTYRSSECGSEGADD